MRIVNVKRVSPIGWEVTTDTGAKYYANREPSSGSLKRVWTPPKQISVDGELGKKIKTAINKAAGSGPIPTGESRKLD